MTFDGNSWSVGNACNTASVGEPRRARQVDHVSEEKLGGKPRPRVVKLRVIGGAVELRDDVPRTRAECPTTRPCGHVKCEWHLWMIAGEDRSGRRFAHETRRVSTLRPVWLEWPLPPSCGADLVERAKAEGWGMRRAAREMGMVPSRFFDVLAKAIAKVKGRAETLRDFVGDAPPPSGKLEREK